MKFILLTTASGTRIHLNPAHIVGYIHGGSSTKVTLSAHDSTGSIAEYVRESPDEIDSMLEDLP